ncbi:solute carrier family 35 member G1-like [Limulus polyphemus]|uniref:Solute carrier family 35 member G1-like n=1 Tax=Limulus polyphemus TaxID=6850 RepID=A0ABM1BVK9_LIMPO|nr:solute carrier family 35 member G1-like [Limulus polyphemus]
MPTSQDSEVSSNGPAYRLNPETTSESTPLLSNSLQKRCWDKFLKLPGLGFMCSLGSGVFVAICSLMFKLLPSINPLEILVFNSVFQTAIFASVIIKTREPLFGVQGERCFLLLRAIIGAVSATLIYSAFQLIPLADASTIAFSAPVFVNVFACVLLGESCDGFHVVTVLTTVTGVFLISKPPFLFRDEQDSDVSTSDRISGSCMALGGCLGMALVFVVMRKLKRTSYSSINIVFSSSIVILDSVVLTVINEWSFPHCGEDGWFIIVSVISFTVASFLQTAALKLEEAGLVSIGRTINVVLSFIFQVMLLEERVGWTSVLGAVLVCSSVGVIGIKRCKNST